MRQRKLIDLDERMEDLKDYLDLDGTQNKGKWRSVFGEDAHEIFLEIGCGKGKFMCERAEAFPRQCIIGLEGQASVIVRAAEKIRQRELARDAGRDDTSDAGQDGTSDAGPNIPNAYLISNYMRDIHDFFENGELDGIFLNFSDPWPKARHAKRRLTYRDNLKGYMDVIKEGGFIEFKTDNDGLFQFTLEEIEALGYNIEKISYDLAGTDFESANFRTEYEEKFMKKGIKIKFVRIEKRPKDIEKNS